MPKKQIQYKTYNSYGLPCVTKLDEGNYTCHNTSKAEVPLKTFVLKVLGKTLPCTTIICFMSVCLSLPLPFLIYINDLPAAAEAILKWGGGKPRGPGGTLPRKILKFRASEMARNASFLLK